MCDPNCTIGVELRHQIEDVLCDADALMMLRSESVLVRHCYPRQRNMHPYMV